MSRSKIIKRFEHSKLLLEQEGFQDHHWKALAEYNEKHKGKFFDLLHNGIKFKEYVGVIQVKNLTIEILPKIDRNELDENAWQGILLDMLRECHWMRVHSHEKASLQYKHNSILDAYLEIYLNACERLLHEGLVKKYRKEESNLFALKGKLKFSQHIRRNLVHEERFFTEHALYDRNNIYNQILLKALQVIPKFTVSAVIRDKLSRLLLDFPELPDVPVTADTFQKLTYDRKTERYKEAIEIAAMLLLNYRPDIRGGHNHVLAILFDMNDLWEEYFFRRLRVSLPPEWHIQPQPRKVFWTLEESRQEKRIKPDIVLTIPKDQNIVIDTKWKTPDGFIPSDDDLKQMFVYNEYWKAQHGILLYPLNEPDGPFKGMMGAYAEPMQSKKCSIVKVDILKPEGGKKVLNRNFIVEHLIKYVESPDLMNKSLKEPAPI
jgi:5-methylcytosine-specific restriction enzyme subunit McrC